MAHIARSVNSGISTTTPLGRCTRHGAPGGGDAHGHERRGGALGLAHEPAPTQPRPGPVQRTGREAVGLGVGAERLVLLAQGAKVVEPELLARALGARNGYPGQRPGHGQPLHRLMNRGPWHSPPVGRRTHFTNRLRRRRPWPHPRSTLTTSRVGGPAFCSRPTTHGQNPRPGSRYRRRRPGRRPGRTGGRARSSSARTSPHPGSRSRPARAKPRSARSLTPSRPKPRPTPRRRKTSTIDLTNPILHIDGVAGRALIGRLGNAGR